MNEHFAGRRISMLNVKSEKDVRRLSNRNTGHDMEKALEFVRSGVSIREAAKLTNLAYATVRRYWLKSLDINNIKNKTFSNATNLKSSYVFNEEQEHQLTKYFGGVSDIRCKKIAYRIAMLNKITVNPDWHANQMASDDWLKDFKLRHSIINNCDNDNSINNLRPSSHINHSSLENSNIQDKRESPLRRSLQFSRPVLSATEDQEVTVPFKCEMDIAEAEYDAEFNDSDFESTSDEDDENEIPIEKINNQNIIYNNVIHTTNNDKADLEDIKIKLETKTNNVPNEEKENKLIQDYLDDEDKTVKTNSLFQSELISTLKMIANSTSSQKDSDELFLISLLPAFKKIKESEKLKARIELIKTLEKFQ